MSHRPQLSATPDPHEFRGFAVNSRGAQNVRGRPWSWITGRPRLTDALVAWVIGDYMRSRRTFFAELVARHQKEREEAAEAERLRIARELHDVVAHNVSVMAIQAGAARVSGNASEETLESIEQGARDTLSELNKLLGVLRKSPGAPDLVPQPTLDDIDALLKPARDAGLTSTVKVSGE